MISLCEHSIWSDETPHICYCTAATTTEPPVFSKLAVPVGGRCPAMRSFVRFRTRPDTGRYVFPDKLFGEVRAVVGRWDTSSRSPLQ
jgi:hypothetical protein